MRSPAASRRLRLDSIFGPCRSCVGTGGSSSHSKPSRRGRVLCADGLGPGPGGLGLPAADALARRRAGGVYSRRTGRPGGSVDDRLGRGASRMDRSLVGRSTPAVTPVLSLGVAGVESAVSRERMTTRVRTMPSESPKT